MGALALTIGDTSVRTDAHARFCLNDLHRAAGGEPRHTPGRFTITQQFKDLALELSRNPDSPEPASSAAGVGTFVARELVYAYAMWISAAFHLKVIRAYDQMVTAPALPNLSDPAALRDLLLGYTEKVLALEATVTAQAPKVAFAEAVGAAENDQKIREVAKALGVGPRKLLTFMKDNGILMRDGLPFQHHLDCGRFRVVEVTFDDPKTGSKRMRLQTRVTGKGVTFLQQKLARASSLDQVADKRANSAIKAQEPVM